MATQPAPDWEAFSAASDRVGNSANQLAKALQASATIPDDLVTISSQLKRLEHQPTNLALQQEMQRIGRQIEQSQQQMAQQMAQLKQEMQQSQQQMQQQIQQQFFALNHNMLARIRNSTLGDKDSPLTPIVNLLTNTPIPNFPTTIAAFNNLTWLQKRIFGIDLGMDDPGASPPTAVRATFTEKLRVNIGLKPFQL